MFSLKQLKSRIWHLHFENHYDLTMHFFRYQEYYESPKFKQSDIKFIDLMDWYSKNMGNGVFTYSKDWAGFNLPGEYIFKIHEDGIKDLNRYDNMMLAMAEFVRAKEDNETNFYFIGTAATDTNLAETFNHELAHGLYFADDEYKEIAYDMVMDMPSRTRSFLFKKLKQCGYSEDVLVDESQAYLSTGLYCTFDTPSIHKQQPKFEKLFKKFAGNLRKK